MAPAHPAAGRLAPTRTLPQPATRVLLPARQVTTTVVSTASSSGGAATLSGGAIAGIVIGAIAGFLLILWLVRSCVNLGHPGLWGATFAPEHEKSPPPPRHSHGAGYRHHHHQQPRSRSRHSRSPVGRRIVRVEPSRGRGPRAPAPVYYPPRASRDARRSGDGRRYRGD
ncbi:hypothetical protein F4780DRAFT_783900 [Xylariomycetidae sp. FL0641]|nr:hypothetical protein F4780DRAFT_783900 [Xylariomycetidae sp. FL0641]